MWCLSTADSASDIRLPLKITTTIENGVDFFSLGRILADLRRLIPPVYVYYFLDEWTGYTQFFNFFPQLLSLMDCLEARATSHLQVTSQKRLKMKSWKCKPESVGEKSNRYHQVQYFSKQSMESEYPHFTLQNRPDLGFSIFLELKFTGDNINVYDFNVKITWP